MVLYGPLFEIVLSGVRRPEAVVAAVARGYFRSRSSDTPVLANDACASIKDTLLAPPAMSGQRSWTASSSQKQMGQISYNPGESPKVR